MLKHYKKRKKKISQRVSMKLKRSRKTTIDISEEGPFQRITPCINIYRRETVLENYALHKCIRRETVSENHALYKYIRREIV
jgi:hypothetical protein